MTDQAITPEDVKVGQRWRVQWVNGPEEVVEIKDLHRTAEWTGGPGVEIELGVFAFPVFALVAQELVTDA